MRFFSKKRYFLVSYYCKYKVSNFVITSLGEFPNHQDMVKKSGADSAAIINIYEFKSKKDYEDYSKNMIDLK